MYTYEPVAYGDYVFPTWADAIGILIGLSTLAPLPIFFAYSLWKGPVSWITLYKLSRSRLEYQYNESTNYVEILSRYIPLFPPTPSMGSNNLRHSELVETYETFSNYKHHWYHDPCYICIATTSLSAKTLF